MEITLLLLAILAVPLILVAAGSFYFRRRDRLARSAADAARISLTPPKPQLKSSILGNYSYRSSDSDFPLAPKAPLAPGTLLAPPLALKYDPNYTSYAEFTATPQPASAPAVTTSTVVVSEAEITDRIRNTAAEVKTAAVVDSSAAFFAELNAQLAELDAMVEARATEEVAPVVEAASASAEEAAPEPVTVKVEAPVKRGPGRPRKHPLPVVPAVKRKPGRPRKQK